MNEDLLVKIEHLAGQINRLISDAESEKQSRRERTREVDKRLKVLEDDKVRRDAWLVAVSSLSAIVGSIITALIIKHL